jgi:predicted PhzF superfamily epimerase YddE/YHI9
MPRRFATLDVFPSGSPNPLAVVLDSDGLGRMTCWRSREFNLSETASYPPADVASGTLRIFARARCR